MAYGTVNADVIGTSVTGSNLGAGNASIMKNRIINGAMVINQRNLGSINPDNGAYFVDRWQAGVDVTGKITVNQSSTAPAGFNNSFIVTSSSAYTPSSTEAFNIRQNIEGYNIADLGWGTANAKTVTLSFQVYSSLTGTFGGSIVNSAYDRSYPFSYTVSSANTWTSISVTIAGDTSGTWLTTNGAGMRVLFGLGAGSTKSGTANTWAGAFYNQPTGTVSVVSTNSATFYITGVQLEVGSSATGFEYRQYGQELALCQRYFVNLGSVQAVDGYRLYASNVYFPVSMRANPTATATSATAFAIPTLGAGSGTFGTNIFCEPPGSTSSTNLRQEISGGTALLIQLVGSKFSAEL